jgi:SAM-dependent methyltransferase
VLEIGSYVGGFLTLARRSACDATGLDVGLQVSAFTRALGLDVRTGVFDPDEFGAESFDVVVVLNCLEQLANPPATLNQIRRVLRRRGALVVRTPNAAFVSRAHEPLVRASALANGVLGAPFVRCWSAAALDGMLHRSGFATVRIDGSMVGAGCSRSRGPTDTGAAAEYPWLDALARLD